jgi:sigma-E factor negative regulatory protein RseB
MSAAGLRWVRQGASRESAAAALSALSAYRASRLPPGFHLTVAGEQTFGETAVPASHLVYSDGVATVSVFIEAAAEREAQPPVEGLARVGSGFAFSTVVQGHQVTALGEVPAQTVEFIAHSVKSTGGGELTSP